MRVARTLSRVATALMGLALLVAGFLSACFLPGRGAASVEARGGHETTDASVPGVIVTTAGLLAFMAIALVIVSSIFGTLTRRPIALHPPAAGIQNPGGYARTPPPQLEPDPQSELAAVRAIEARRLNDYAWVNREAGVVRIPIARAMELVAQRGLPARPAAPATMPSPSRPSSEPGEVSR